MKCNKVKHCKDCKFYFDDPVDMFCWDDRCRRLQTASCNPVYHAVNWKGKLLWCSSEREQGKTIFEYIFGENKDKCGEGGRFWQERSA